jgi:hypothetical protein
VLKVLFEMFREELVVGGESAATSS